MLIQQYMSEFVDLVSKDTFKFTTDNQNAIKNKLEIVIPMFVSSGNDEIDTIPAVIVDSFVRSLYKILNQSLLYVLDQQIVNSSMKFLANAVAGEENRIRTTILREIKYPVLVSILVKRCSGEKDKGQLDLLTVIKEVLEMEVRVDEHNIKLLVAAFKDFDSMPNPDEKVVKMFAELLINLCIRQPSTKTHILRRIRTTNIVEKLNKSKDNLMAFKYYIVLENDSIRTDVIYFLKMSLREILSSLKEMNLDAVNDSLFIIEKMVASQKWHNVSLVDDENVSSLIEKLTADLMSKMHHMKTYATVYFGKVLQFFQWLLDMSPESAALFDPFVNETCELDSIVTSQFLDFLSGFVASRSDLTGTKDNIATFSSKFLSKLQDPKKNYSLNLKNSFILILRNYQAKLKASNELDYNKIAEFMTTSLAKYKNASLSRLEEEDFHHFIYIVYTLHAFRSLSKFKNLADETFSSPLLSVFIARGLLAKKSKVVAISTRLASFDKVQTERIAEIVVSTSLRDEIGFIPSQPSHAEPVRFNFSKFAREKLEMDIETTIDKVKAVLENNDIPNIKVSDVMELCRLKYETLHNSYDIAESRIEELITEVGNLHEFIRKQSEISRAHETEHWQTRIENESFLEREKESANKMQMLQQSLQQATAMYQKECEKNKQIEVLKAAHAQEIRKIQQTHEKQLKDKQDEIQKLDHNLQEAETMKKTIMSLMSTKSFK